MKFTVPEYWYFRQITYCCCLLIITYSIGAWLSS